MLLQFSVENFLSFHEKQMFTTLSSSYKEHQNSLITFQKKRYSKVAAMFGANASGKTNFIKALDFVKNYIQNSNNMLETSKIPVYSFMLNKKKLSCFEFLLEINDMKYKYGFSVNQEYVEEEYLYIYPNNRETLVFFRRNENQYEFNSFKGQLHDISFKNTKNKLFLVTSANWNFEVSKPVVQWFVEDLIISFDVSSIDSQVFDRLQNDAEFYEFSMDLLKVADININNMDLKQIDIKKEEFFKAFPDIININKIDNDGIKVYQISSIHRYVDENGDEKAFQLPFELESLGTRSLLGLGHFLYECMKNHKTLIIDEIDRSLHPEIVQYVVKLFTTSHTNNSQLIFNTHDMHLLDLDLLRRDQIWLIDKGENCFTEMINLSEFSVRKTDDIMVNYLLGRYGAIPLIKDSFNWME